MDSSQLYAGVSSVNITPPVGACLSGSFIESKSTGVLDDLFVNVLVLNMNNKDIVFISADIVFIPNPIYHEIIALIKQEVGVPEEHIILSATHTHKGTMLEDSIGVWHHSPDYVETFKRGMVNAAAEAIRHKQRVRLGVGKAENPNHAFNRRYQKPDGSIVMSWAYDETLHQNCMTEGPVDREMTVLKIEDIDGKPLSFVVNYATHNNAAGGSKFSADISGAMIKILKQVYGDHVVVLFVQGACGDIASTDHRLANRYEPAKHLKIGKGLAGTVLQIDAAIEYPEINQFELQTHKLTIPNRSYCEYDTHEDDTFGTIEKGQVYFQVYKNVKETFGDSEQLHDLNITAIKLGEEIAIVTNPGEIFAEIGLAIKEQSPYKYTFVFELTNGYEGYVPTERAFLAGGYEVRKLDSNSHLARDADEQIIKASVELLKRL